MKSGGKNTSVVFIILFSVYVNIYIYIYKVSGPCLGIFARIQPVVKFN